MDTSKPRTEVWLTAWKNRELDGWINANFKGHDRDVAYTVLLWLGDTYPEMRDKLGISSEKVS